MLLLKYICSWSGGKDSTASIILAHEHNEPLDIILFAEVMFDKKRNISGENPKHIDFIMNVGKPLFESWGYKVEILRADTDYLEQFHRIIERPIKNFQNKGLKNGFPLNGRCGIKRDCKVKPIKKYLKELQEPYRQYVGITVDEPKRLESLYKDSSQISLLDKYGYTEEMARELCEQYRLLSPCYELSKRGGCWFCMNAKLAEMREIKEMFPDTWKEFVRLEDENNVANYKWNVYGKSTLKEINEQLEFEKQQMTIFDFLD